MKLDISVELDYAVPAPTDLILQIEAPSFADQRVLSETMDVSPTAHMARVCGEEGFGERCLIRTAGDFRCSYQAQIEVDRPALDISLLDAVPPHLLPGNTIRYLMPSRFCISDQMYSFVGDEFGALSGGARIAAMRDWIFERYEYAPGSSNSQTTAIDTFVQRQGVCRDFAHVLITFARASSIPARFVSVYAPYVTPQDFHAVAEIFLEGTWHLVDATGMSAANQIVRIGVGADAAEVPFLSGFGWMTMNAQSVCVLPV